MSSFLTFFWKKVSSLLYPALCVSLFIIFYACGDTGQSPSDTGSISFNVEWIGAPTIKDAAGPVATRAFDCIAADVSLVEATVYDQNYSLLASGGPWNCNDHSGRIDNVPIGFNYIIEIIGKNPSGDTIYQGEQTGINVYTGQTTNAGTISVSFIFSVSSPTFVSATAEDGQVTLNWDSVSEATSYNIYWSTSSGVTIGIGTKISDVTSPYTHTGQTNGTTYYYVVTAANSYGESGLSNEVSATPGTAPSAPANLTATPSVWTNNNSFSIDWTNPSDVIGIAGAYYKLDAVPESNTDGTYTTDKPFNTSATVEGGEDIYVWLVDENGNTDYNNNSSTTLYYDAALPSNPTSASGYNSSSKTTLLTSDNWYNYTNPYFEWTDASDGSSGIVGYYVYFGTDSSADPATSGTIQTDAYYSVTDALVSGSTYYLLINTKDNAGNIATSTYQAFIYKYDSTLPTNPTSTSGYNSSSKTTLLTSDNWYNYTNPYFEWTDASDGSSGIVGYYVYFGTDSSADPATSGTIQTDAYYSVTDALVSGSTYYLLINTKDNAGNIATSTYQAFIYKYDSTLPTNPTSTSGYSSSSKTTSLTSGNSYTYQNPYFEWAGASDSGSNIAGYYVYFGGVLVLFSDDFPSTTIDTSKWTNNGASINDVGNNETSGSYSLDVEGAESIESIAINLSGYTTGNVTLSYYYERTGGGDVMESGENFYLEYFNNSGSWVILKTYDYQSGSTTSYTQETITLPDEAFHSGFKIRYRNTGTSGGYDDYFVDDVVIEGTSPGTFQTNSNYEVTNAMVYGSIYYLIIKTIDEAGNVSTNNYMSFTYEYIGPTTEGFESGDFSHLAWITGGDDSWQVTSNYAYNGSYAAEAPVSIGNNQSSYLEITLNCQSVGNISFWFKVSSESTFDYLRFKIDGTEKGKWSGELDWAQATFPVNSGTYTFKWEYTKDVSLSIESDTAWIDDIVFW